MQKQLKILGIAILLLFVCIGAFFAIRQIGDKVEETQSLQTKTLLVWKIPAGNIDRIEVERAENSYLIVQTDDGYVVKGYEGLPKNGHMYEHALSIATVEAEEQLQGEFSLADFGLETPAATITLFSNDMVNKRADIGNMMPDGTSMYILVDDVVYISKAEKFLLLLQPPTAYLSTDLAPYSANPSVVNLRSVTFTDEKGEAFTVEKTPVDNTVTYSTGYSIVKPDLGEVRYEKIDELTQEALILQGEVVQVFPTTEDLERYGLLSPQAKMAVSCAIMEEDKSVDDPSLEMTGYTILLGQYDPADRTYYAQVEGEALIYKVLEEAVPWVHYTPYAILSTNLLAVPAAQVAKIEVKTSSETYTCILSGENPREGEMDGYLLSETSFSLYYELLSRGRGKSYVEREEHGEALLTVIFTFTEEADLEPLVWTFYGGEGSDLIVRTSDPRISMDMTIARAYVEKLLSTTRTLSEGEEIENIQW